VWLWRLDGDHENLRSVLRWLIASGRSEEVATLIGGGWYFWVARGRVREVMQSVETALDLSYPVPLQRAAVLACVGELFRHSGDHQRAKSLKEEALPIFVEHGDLPMAAALLYDLGEIAAVEGEFLQARELHQESLALRQKLRRPSGIAHALTGVASDELQDRDYDAVRETAKRIIEIGRELDDPEFVMAGLINLGEVALRQTHLEEATSRFHEALQIAAPFGDLQVIQTLIDSLARVRAARHEPEEAARLWGVAEAMRESGGFGFGIFIPGADQEKWDAISAVRRELPEERFLAAWAGGRSLSTEQAIMEALQANKPT
jgi:tetratricopeptide (TPR) repeat protein